METDADRERATRVPPTFPGGERQSVGGWIRFGVVAFFWLPMLYILVNLILNSSSSFDAAIEFVALSTVWCLPLAIACCLIRWAGYPGTAWAMLASLGIATLLMLVAMFAAGASGRSSSTAQEQAIGIWAAVISLPAWLMFVCRHFNGHRKRPVAGTAPRGDGDRGSGDSG
ncbi:MAG: hypothetical protein OXI22_22890 [Defluviicoccus sp.]|nr:hypothetical protein [Defluviicoccus sp.]